MSQGSWPVMEQTGNCMGEQAKESQLNTLIVVKIASLK
jgi:hypothetical protein